MMSGCAISLEDFKKQIELFLAGPEPEGHARATPTLFPPEQPPDLLVFVGEPDAGKMSEIRAQLPARSFLFYLYLPEHAKVVAPVLPMEGRTLACPLDFENGCREKLAFLLARLPRRRVRLIIDNAVQAKMGNWPRELRETIVFALERCQQDRNRGLIRMRCSMLNMPSIIANRGLRLLPVPPGTEAIVCSAGPSLELQLDLLKAAQGRALLLAVGHAAGVLIRAGIRPDIIVEVDSQAHLNWPEELMPDSLLAATADVAPAVASRFQRVLWFAPASPAFAEGMAAFGLSMPELAAARTVAASALDLAIRLGCCRVALAGQDLCLGEGDKLHAGEASFAEHEHVIETLGNDGGKVRTTRELNELREGLQAFLRAVNRAFAGKTPAPLLLNCTRGGARIEGIAGLELEAFVKGLPAEAQFGGLCALGPAPDIAPAIQGLARDLKQMSMLAVETARAAGELAKNEAACAATDARARAQQVFKASAAREAEFASRQPFALWMRPLLSFAQGINAEMPIPQGMDEPRVEFEKVRRRSLLTHDLCDDFVADLEAVGIGATQTGELPPGAAARDPNAFIGFRRMAIRCFETANPQLAAWMAQQPFPAEAPAGRFQVRWSNQMVPFARVRERAGKWIAMTSICDVAAQAREDVGLWTANPEFDPARHAVLFVAPGTWLHVLEFVRLHPRARMAVVEPWPEWLSALCDHGCFAHALPHGTLVVAALRQLAGWRGLLEKRIVQWRKAGLGIRVFPHPRISAMPEIAALIDELTPAR